MAISFSRPDPSSPAAVGSAAFPIVRRGFDQGEVRDFLRMVAAELARLQERERFLENELRAMQTRGMSSPGRLDEETVTTLLGEEAARVLSTARDASLQIRERAEESATRLVKDAAEDASRIREAANVDAARIREDASVDAESEIEMAKQQGRDMVNEAREYREKVLSELARRRDAAREQIDKLLHGRDRLINAFERARIASESVIGELTDAHDEPEFIVDLAPTTGPVPVVNPAHPSFTPGVKIFDREAEESQSVSPRPPVNPQRPSVIDIPIDEPEPVRRQPVSFTPVPRDEVAGTTPVDHVVIEEDLVVVEETSITDEEIAAAIEEIAGTFDAAADLVGESGSHDVDADDDSAPSNVVSLFGRGRRAPDVPTVADPPVVEVESPVVEVEPPIVEPEAIIEEPEAIVVEPEVTVDVDVDDAEPKGGGHAMDSVLDDIFAKLRGTSTAEVAEMANGNNAAVGDTRSSEVKTSGKRPPVSKKHTPVSVDGAVFSARDELVGRLALTVARRLKRVLADEQNVVLEHLRQKKSSLDMDALLGTVDQQTARYAAAITAEMMEAAGAGAKAAKGSTRRVTADDVAEGTAAAVRKLIVEAFRVDMRNAMGAEADRAVLAERVRDLYRTWKSDRMDSVVDDITREAHSHGVVLSLEPGVSVAWVVAPGGCCSDCEDNSLAGSQPTGTEFPAGQVFAPAHAGCCCLVWPVRN